MLSPANWLEQPQLDTGRVESGHDYIRDYETNRNLFVWIVANDGIDCGFLSSSRPGRRDDFHHFGLPLNRIMKTLILISLLILLSSLKTSASPETNAVYLKVLQASSSVSNTIQVLPEIEKLWPQEPEAYLKSVRQAAQVLGGTSGEGKKAFLDLFKSMMQKPCPTNVAQTITWIELKQEVVLFYLSFDEIQRTQTNWIVVAKFIGEVRSKIIPHYTNQAVMISGLTLGHPEALREMVNENAQKANMDELQVVLRQADRLITFQLLNVCPRHFPSSDSANADFIKEISKAAHLTNEECHKL